MYSRLILLIAALMICVLSRSTNAQCTVGNLRSVNDLAREGLVIDVRPDQINQFKGKSEFKDEAHIALVNMNPFLFSYTLKVDQTEIHDTGFLNFLKLLGSPVSDLIGSVSASSKNEALSATTGGSLERLIADTATKPPAPHVACPANQVGDANSAITRLDQVRTKVVDKLNGGGGVVGLKTTMQNTANQYTNARNYFLAEKGTIFNSSVDDHTLCTRANALHGNLTGANYPTEANIRTLLTDVKDFQSLVEELKNSAVEYTSEFNGCPARINGLNYANGLSRLADELAKLGRTYEAKVSAMLEETKSYNALVETIKNLNTHERELLQKEYTVTSRYDISALDIIATAVPLGDTPNIPRKDQIEQRLVGNIQTDRASASSAQANARTINIGATESAQGVQVFAPHGARFRAQAEESGAKEEGGDSGSGNAGAKQIRTSGIIGARRFEISGGMVFSSLGRREFQPVLGFPRNAQGETIDPETGNPTTTPKLTKIVGLSEDTSRRFAPLAMLHYRIPYTQNIFASVGFTGKRDDHGVDLEYLFGPSILYRNLFLTFGGYVGKKQKLAGDLFEGAPVEGDIPVRKEYKWGFGFSMTFKIPLGDKKKE